MGFSFGLNCLAVTADFQHGTNLLSIATKGGFLMIVLLLISIFSIKIIIEKLIKFKKSKKSEGEFLEKIYDHLKNSQDDKAIQICREREDSPLANVIAKAIDDYDVRGVQIKDTMDLAIKIEVHNFEKNLGTLATFAAIAPLIGFLGTVTGMVKVFMKISETGGGVDISLMASGIWEALITTVGGLTVGIICILFYNHLIGKLETLARILEDKTNEFLVNVRRINNGS